jgi:hypothetical protein
MPVGTEVTVTEEEFEPEPYCGDGVCGTGENPGNCWDDCGIEVIALIASESNGVIEHSVRSSQWNGTEWINNQNITLQENTGNGYPVYLKQYFDDSGNSILLWTNTTTGRNLVYSYWNGSFWSTPVKQVDNLSDDGYYSFDFSSTNTGKLAHSEDLGGAPDVQIEDWSSGSFSNKFNLTDDATYSEESPTIDFYGSEAMVVFLYNFGNALNYSRWTGSWSTPASVIEINSNDPNFAFASDGTGMLVWRAYTTNAEILAKNWTGTWGETMNISRDGNSADNYPLVGYDWNDKAVVVWGNDTNPSAMNLAYSYWDGSSWSTPTNMTDYDPILKPQIIRNKNEAIIVLFYIKTGATSYTSNIKIWNGSGWDATEQLDLFKVPLI